MASAGSSTQGSRTAAGAPAADGGHLAPQPSHSTNFVAVPATQIIGHLNRHRRQADFDHAALELAARDRRLAEAEQRLRVGDTRAQRLLEGNRVLKAQIRQAAEREETLRAEIRALQQARAADAKAPRPLKQPRAANNAKARAGRGSRPSGRGPTPARGEVGHDVPRTRGYRALRMQATPPDELPSSGDESVGFYDDTSVDASSDEGELGGPSRPRYKSLRMNASSPSGARQAKQPRRRQESSDD